MSVAENFGNIEHSTWYLLSVSLYCPLYLISSCPLSTCSTSYHLTFLLFLFYHLCTFFLQLILSVRVISYYLVNRENKTERNTFIIKNSSVFIRGRQLSHYLFWMWKIYCEKNQTKWQCSQTTKPVCMIELAVFTVSPWFPESISIVLTFQNGLKNNYSAAQLKYWMQPIVRCPNAINPLMAPPHTKLFTNSKNLN